MTKEANVLQYLRTHKKGITSIQAYDMFNATRLSAIIFDLRKKYAITTVKETGYTDDGKAYPYARYVYMGEL